MTTITPADASAYIAEMATELARLATAHGRHLLAHLLITAAAEARDLVGGDPDQQADPC